MTKTLKGHHEIEFKLNAPADEVLQSVWSFMFGNPKIFTPPTHHSLLTHIPAHIRSRFAPPVEITSERIRIYYDTEDLNAYDAGIEIRQERRSKSGVKQMIKIGGNASSDDPVMDRMEYSSDLNGFGVDLRAIHDKKISKDLDKSYKGCIFKPLVWMVSQRHRFKYHPEGNPNICVEVGLDYPCVGITMHGFEWEAPQMEIEMVKGPDSHAAARGILEFEAERFAQFKLEREILSKPAPGYDALRDYLKTPEGRKAFAALDPNVLAIPQAQKNAPFVSPVLAKRRRTR